MWTESEEEGVKKKSGYILPGYDVVYWVRFRADNNSAASREAVEFIAG